MNISSEKLQQIIKELIRQSAPEKEEELLAQWNIYSPIFELTQDKPGFFLEAGAYGLVLFTNRTMLYIWLLGHASWRALTAFSPLVVLRCLYPNGIQSKNIDNLPGQKQSYADYEKTRYSIKTLSQITNLIDYKWPVGIPVPQPNPPSEITEKAIFELIVIATAFVFLHEVKHIILKQGGSTPRDPREEEKICDRYAFDFLVADVDSYSKKYKEDRTKVLSKRAMGISLAFHLYLVATPKEARGGTQSHPAVFNRISDLALKIDLPKRDQYWVFLSSIVLSVLKHEKILPMKIKLGTPKTTCLILLKHSINE